MSDKKHETIELPKSIIKNINSLKMGESHQLYALGHDDAIKKSITTN